jgi:hypothetical protein
MQSRKLNQYYGLPSPETALLSWKGEFRIKSMLQKTEGFFFLTAVGRSGKERMLC